ncbi:MAG: D-aminoacyl-tRNA deacylase [Phycisphaerae bacterium]
MRTLVQRIERAEVVVGNEVVGRAGAGLLVYVGVALSDTAADANKLAGKVANIRIFEDSDEKLNLSVKDVAGEILAIPNFTLQADARKGRRPSFINAQSGQTAEDLFNAFVAALQSEGCPVQTGQFGAEMYIESVAAGPVNIVVDIPPDSGPGK